jgi:hypothetical protein
MVLYDKNCLVKFIRLNIVKLREADGERRESISHLFFSSAPVKEG